MKELWDGDGVPSPPPTRNVNRQTPVKTVPSPCGRNLKTKTLMQRFGNVPVTTAKCLQLAMRAEKSGLIAWFTMKRRCIKNSLVTKRYHESSRLFKTGGKVSWSAYWLNFAIFMTFVNVRQMHTSLCCKHSRTRMLMSKDFCSFLICSSRFTHLSIVSIRTSLMNWGWRMDECNEWMKQLFIGSPWAVISTLINRMRSMDRSWTRLWSLSKTRTFKALL